jgi:hypothetical protein
LELKHRVEALELAVDTILKRVPEVRISVEGSAGSNPVQSNLNQIACLPLLLL